MISSFSPSTPKDKAPSRFYPIRFESETRISPKMTALACTGKYHHEFLKSLKLRDSSSDELSSKPISPRLLIFCLDVTITCDLEGDIVFKSCCESRISAWPGTSTAKFILKVFQYILVDIWVTTDLTEIPVRCVA